MKKTIFLWFIGLFFSFCTLVNGQDVSIEGGLVHAYAVQRCSRSRSRTAQQVLDKYFLPFVVQHKYTLSRRCRLHPENNLFLAQEKSKQKNNVKSWKCGLCGKAFKGEEYLDMHLTNRHSLDLPQNVPCLADVCPLIHCNQLELRPRSKLERPEERKCLPSQKEKLRHKCEVMIEGCFPHDGGPAALYLHGVMMRQFCAAHTCDKVAEYFPEGGRRKSNQLLYYCGGLIIFSSLALFYFTLYQHRMEMRHHGDLRRVSRERPTVVRSRTSMFGLLQKPKQY